MSEERPPHCEFDAEGLKERLEVTLTGDVRAIAPAVESIMEIVAEMDCARGHEDHIEVVLQEALANAVIHGCKGDPDKHVEVCVGCDDRQGMLIIVRDPGGGFDPGSLPNPVLGEQIFSSHGRGIYLINQLMDEVEFKRGGTEIRMRKKTRAD